MQCHGILWYPIWHSSRLNCTIVRCTMHAHDAQNLATSINCRRNQQEPLNTSNTRLTSHSFTQLRYTNRQTSTVIIMLETQSIQIQVRFLQYHKCLFVMLPGLINHTHQNTHKSCQQSFFNRLRSLRGNQYCMTFHNNLHARFGGDCGTALHACFGAHVSTRTKSRN